MSFLDPALASGLAARRDQPGDPGQLLPSVRCRDTINMPKVGSRWGSNPYTFIREAEDAAGRPLVFEDYFKSSD